MVVNYKQLNDNTIFDGYFYQINKPLFIKLEIVNDIQSLTANKDFIRIR